MMTEQAHKVLADIESIKQLKARYCRFLDTKDWVAWRGIFTDDFVSDTSEAGGKVIAGADDFVAFVRKNLARPSQPTAHQVHTPEIEVTSATTATGHLGAAGRGPVRGRASAWWATATTTRPTRRPTVSGGSRRPS